MRTGTGLLLLLLLPCAHTLAQDEAEQDRGTCISLRQLDEVEIIDERNIAFVMRNGDIYLNRLARTCTGLRPRDTIGYRTSTGRLCSVDTINVLSDFPQPLTTRISCGLGQFERITEDTLAILSSSDEGISLSELGGPVEADSPVSDVTGDWHIASSLGDTPIEVNCQLVQSGADLTGTCTPVMENPETSQLAGTTDGQQIEWSYNVVFNGNPGHVAFDGEMKSDSLISGTLNLSGTPTEFSATRRSAE